MNIFDISVTEETYHDPIPVCYTDVRSKDEVEDILGFLKQYKVLRCPVKDDWKLLRIKDITCVSWIMRLIGFYRWWIFTPYQLYCALIKAGYKSFYEPKDPNYDKKTEKNI